MARLMWDDPRARRRGRVFLGFAQMRRTRPHSKRLGAAGVQEHALQQPEPRSNAAGRKRAFARATRARKALAGAASAGARSASARAACARRLSADRVTGVGKHEVKRFLRRVYARFLYHSRLHVLVDRGCRAG
jgi:hypothetical protein